MNCFYQLLLTLSLLLGMAPSVFVVKESSLSAQKLEPFRQAILIRSVRTLGGLNRLDAKISSLSRAPVLSEEERETLAFFQRMRFQTQLELTFLERMDQSLQAFQEQQAEDAPSYREIPESIQEFTAQGPLSLPVGAPKNRSGFERACPAETQADNGNQWNEAEMLNLAEDLKNASSDSGLAMPASGVISAGTWAYPSGALHLGMDLALPMYTPVRAPADGVILYAASVTGDAGGYLGNWIGWPYGGGNTIAMICRSEGRLYGVTFCHLSSRIMIRPGQKVHQGDILAYSGNTGNSTGPHTHIELFELRVSFEEAVQYFQQAADFSFGTGWSAPAVCSSVACQRRPELYFE